MTPTLAVVGVLLLAFSLRYRARRRRLRLLEARMRAVAFRHDERAANAALRPRTGLVVVHVLKPPPNGKT